jgi:hypothetical protein
MAILKKINSLGTGDRPTPAMPQPRILTLVPIRRLRKIAHVWEELRASKQKVITAQEMATPSAKRIRACYGCRTRKIKCDRALPQCSACSRFGVDCELPPPPSPILWMPASDGLDKVKHKIARSDNDTTRSRRSCLYTGKRYSLTPSL